MKRLYIYIIIYINILGGRGKGVVLINFRLDKFIYSIQVNTRLNTLTASQG